MKILLLGDAPMALNEGGINQTLYNLFSFIDPENFLGITEVDQQTLKKLGSTEPYTNRYISYRLNLVDIPINRFTRFLQPLIQKINFYIFQKSSYKKIKKQISLFAPDIIISCSNTSSGILMHDKLLNYDDIFVPIIPYFMDDWMYKLKLDYTGKFVNSIIQNMLQKNKHWMMIGEELGKILSVRYHAKPDQILYVRNPVDLSNAPTDTKYVRKSVFEIAYAGALWPMHYDSFYAFAKAVKLVSADTNIKLVLYTQESQWSWRKPELEPLGVIYGGHLPYNQIHQTLNKADALLITASFNLENFTHSTGSLQTKMTDYCKSRRLIISCAPDYAANNKFIKEHQCGICIETNNETEIAKSVYEIINNMEHYQSNVKNAWETLDAFSKDTVHANIKRFLNMSLEKVSSKN